MRNILFLVLAAFFFQNCSDGGASRSADAQKITSLQASVDSLMQLRQSDWKPGFIHTVFFWLKEDLTEDQRAAFLAGAQSLRGVKTIRRFYFGKPAGTPRDVVDNSYDYALILHFDDAASQASYQADPIHQAFAQSADSFWTRVQVYDALVE